MRELQPAELDALRKTAEGKLRTPKSKELRRRNAQDAAGLPTVAPRPTIHPRPAKSFVAKPFQERSAAVGDSRPGKFFAPDKTKPFRPARPAGEGFRPTADRPSGRPAWQKNDRPARPARFTESSPGASRPAAGRTYGDRPATGSNYGARPASKRPAWKKPELSDRTANKRPVAPRRQTTIDDEDFGPVRPPNLHIEEILQPEPFIAARPSAPRSSSARPSSGRPFTKSLPRAFTTSSGKPRAGGARPNSKPGRPYNSGARPASGPRTIDPRTGSGYRPSPGGKRSYDGPSTGSGSRPPRPYTPRAEGASGSRFPKTKKFAGASRGIGAHSEGPGGERKTGTGWKPKTRYGGPNKPTSGVRSKPRPGSSAKSGAPTDRSSSVGWKSAYKGKPGGKRTDGASGGKKRGY